MKISLQNYDFELKYISGKEIKVADQLSRAYLKDVNITKENKSICDNGREKYKYFRYKIRRNKRKN